ncbi:MAG: hypothetical protein ABW208_28195 [Pyrinomonadaceae bacterium]
MKPYTGTALRNILIVCACVVTVTAPAQTAVRTDAAAGTTEVRPAGASFADGVSLLNSIKDVESPTARAYLYRRLAAWLWRNAGDDPSLRQAAFDASARGLSDIHAHEREIPPTPAWALYGELLDIARQHNPSEAERLERAHPLRAKLDKTQQEKAGGELHAAMSKLGGGGAASAEALERAASLIGSGEVPVMALHGELLRLDRLNSPALPRLLSATLALEERRAGSLPLENMHFLSGLFLKESMPIELKARFLAAALKATQLGPEELRARPQSLNWAILLLRSTLPSMQKLTPDLYALAAARLAALAPGVPQADTVYERIKASDDPLSATISEANSAGDPRLRNELLTSAARLAKEQGKLRQAAELIASVEENRAALPEGYSRRDEILGDIVGASLKGQDLDTAAYAASKVGLAVNAAAAWQLFARHLLKSSDAQGAAEKLELAAKALADAPEGKGKTLAYLGLSTDFLELDPARASQLAAEAVRAANRISRPKDAEEGQFSWSLFPLADAATKTFQSLARKDRGGASSLAATFQLKEIKLAALLGVYSSAGK